MDSQMSTVYVHRGGGSMSTSSGSTSGTGGGERGGRVAVVGVTRSVRLRRRGPSGFGFSLRGGREHAAGFYVSDVQPGGEAHRNGLRIGDQIIRVNGYPVEDAVHQEVALLAKNQQVLVLKIRSVGMIPVKDNPTDPVTWHMVQQHQKQEQQKIQNGAVLPSTTELRIRISVGTKGRLGCGVCRGTMPGLTVQGTREEGAARAAGLRPGDVIVWCNGHRLTDLPFDRAVDAMRSSDVLDLVVHRPLPNNHLYDSPEACMRISSGYNSEAASPPPLHPSAASSQHQSSARSCTTNGRMCCPLALSTGSCSSSEWNNVDQVTEWTRKPNNTTVIRVNQIQNQNQNREFVPYRPAHGPRREEDLAEPLYDPVAPRMTDYETHDFDSNVSQSGQRNGSNGRVFQTSAEPRPDYNGSKDEFRDQSRLAEVQLIQKQTETERKTVTTVEVHHVICPPPPPCMPGQNTHKWQAESKPMSAVGKQMGSTMSMGSTGSTETESSLDSASTSSSLSSSSCEPATSTTSSVSVASTPNVAVNFTGSTVESIGPRCHGNDLGSAIAQELQRRAQQRTNGVTRADPPNQKAQEIRKSQTSESVKNSRAQEQKVTHDKLMEEFKRAHQRMFSSAQQRQTAGAFSQANQLAEQEQERRLENGSVARLRQSEQNSPPPAPPPPSRQNANDDAVEMQSIESFKLKDPPNIAVPKPPQTYFPPPPLAPGGNAAPGSPVRSSSVPKTTPVTGASLASAKDSMKPASGKVAIRIAAYAGETKAPSKLEFLGPATAGVAEVKDVPVVSRLQDELAATLQRSNLKKKTDGENGAIKMAAEREVPATKNEPVISMRGNVEKLAAVLANKVTVKVSPDPGSRQE